jgi:hypothetical protein
LLRTNRDSFLSIAPRTLSRMSGTSLTKRYSSSSASIFCWSNFSSLHKDSKAFSFFNYWFTGF